MNYTWMLFEAASRRVVVNVNKHYAVADPVCLVYYSQFLQYHNVYGFCLGASHSYRYAPAIHSSHCAITGFQIDCIVRRQYSFIHSEVMKIARKQFIISC